LSRARPLRWRQPIREDGDEDDIVDSEHDLKKNQGYQRDPRFGIIHPHQPLSHTEIPALSF